MKKLSKKTLIIFLFIFTLSILSSCTKNNTSVIEPSLNDMKNKLEEKMDLSNMDIGDSEKLEKLYDINPEELEEFLLYIPKTNIEANEIGIFKVKDTKDVDNIKEKVENRVKGQADIFKDYLPEEYYLIEKHVLKTKDNYVLFIISEEAGTIEKVFDEGFK